jgi:hypothetical protein
MSHHFAKISYAAEIVLCTQHEQSTQSSKLHVYTQFRSSLPWHVTHAPSSVTSSTLLCVKTQYVCWRNVPMRNVTVDEASV